MNKKTYLQKLLFGNDTSSSDEHIPVLGFAKITKYYDVILYISGLGKRFKQKISTLPSLKNPPEVVVDLGCGTGTQLRILHTLYPKATTIGIDPDSAVLQDLKTDLKAQNIPLTLINASATETTLQTNSVSICYSTLTFHHLTSEEKVQAFREVYRILKPGGTFLLTDWGKLWFTPFRYLLIFEDQERLEDHINDRIPSFAHNAGFTLLKTTKVKPTGIWAWEFKKPETIS